MKRKKVTVQELLSLCRRLIDQDPTRYPIAQSLMTDVASALERADASSSVNRDVDAELLKACTDTRDVLIAWREEFANGDNHTETVLNTLINNLTDALQESEANVSR